MCIKTSINLLLLKGNGLDCRGSLWSAHGILPMKHALRVTPTMLYPKEGYGHWTAPLHVGDGVVVWRKKGEGE